MKQYIKKVLWIIPFIFSLNLSATTYYFRGTTNEGWKNTNWSTLASGTGGTNPPNYSTNLYTHSTTGSAIVDMSASSDIWDLNGKDVDLNECHVGSATFQSASNKVYINGVTASSTYTQGVLDIISASPPIFNCSTDFYSNSNYVYYSNTSPTTIVGTSYYDLYIYYTDYTLASGTLKIYNSLYLDGTNVNVNTTTNLGSNYLSLSGATLEFVNGSSLLTNQTSRIIFSGGTITDNRSHKLYECDFVHNNTQDLVPLVYTNLRVLSNCKLANNTVVKGKLDLGSNLAAGIILNLNGYKLTVDSLNTFSSRAVPTPATRSRINAVNGTLEITNQSLLTLLSTWFGTSNLSSNSTINNLIINGSQIVTLGNNLTISGDLTLTKSSLDLGGLTLTYSGTSISRGTGAIIANGSNSKIIFTNSNNNTTVSLGSSVISNNEISNVEISFPNRGTLVTNSNLTIKTNITHNTSDNYFNINGYTVTIEGTLSNSNGTSGGMFTGSALSNLVIQSNSTLYFDQRYDINRTLRNLTIGGSGVTVTLGNWLNITGGTSTSGYGVVDVIAASNNLYTQGYLTLKSNEYGTAMIGSNPGNISYNSSSNNGTLLMENYIAGNSTKGRQYRFLSSPVSGGVFWQWRDSSNSRSGRGTHITGKTGTVNIANDSFDISTTNHPSAFYYDETKAGNTTGIGNTSASEDAGWSRLINAKTGTIENGKGYRVLIRGDRSITLTSSTTTTPVNTTIQTRGGYVAGPVSVPITNSSTKTNNGINLVGNPYACAVDWVTVQSNSTSVDPTYVAFDVSSKSYQSYNATGGGGLMSRYISPGQGFLVYTTAASTNLVFPTTSKTTAQAGGRIFTEIKNNHLVTRLMKDSGTYDATIIYFIKGATNYYDAYDAGHIENSNVNLSSLDSTNTLYNLNCMDSLIGTRIIPLSLYGTPTGTYTMAFDDVNTFKNHDVYLIDNYLQKTTKVDDMTQYQVNVNTDKFSYAEGRLAISFEPKPMTSVVTLNKTDIFNISPNPVKDQLNVKMDNQLMGTIEYEIFNISGQSMMSGAFNSKETKINTSKLTTGIYFINLRANNETQTIKFIK